MSQYFFVHDYERYHGLIAPALANSALRRDFAPCRECCVQLKSHLTTFAQRYRLRLEDCVWPRILNGMKYDRRLWTTFAGELLLFGAMDVPEIATASEELTQFLGNCELIRQMHDGTRDIKFGHRVYRPDAAGLNDRDDVVRIATLLGGLETAQWTIEGGTGELDKAETLAFARDCFIALNDLYQNAAIYGQIIICEEI